MLRTTSPLLASDSATSAVNSRTRSSTAFKETCQSDLRFVSIDSGESYPTPAIAGTNTFSIRSFDLVRTFVEALTAKGHEIDWDALEGSVADSDSLERAIGRAVVIADQMSRSPLGDRRESPLGEGSVAPTDDDPLALHAEPQLSSNTGDPFFAFNVADVVPDFGDASRYRTRVARRMTRIFGPNGG